MVCKGRRPERVFKGKRIEVIANVPYIVMMYILYFIGGKNGNAYKVY